MTRGEVWWGHFRPPIGRRPVVLVSRPTAYLQRSLYIVVPVTTRARGIPAEVELGRAEGLQKDCVVNCDTVMMASRADLIHRIGELAGERLAKLDDALKFALGLDK